MGGVALGGVVGGVVGGVASLSMTNVEDQFTIDADTK